MTARELKPLLREHGLRLSKRLGQHYLIDARIIERLMEHCQLSSRDTVVEIGAGLGALTEPLAHRAARVIAVEIDQGICALLKTRLSYLTNVTILCEDIREFSWERVAGSVVVGAIPYVHTSAILAALSQHRQTIPPAIVIIQQEVAQRLLAKPGTKAYGRLSLLGQYGWTLTSLMAVPRSAFFPQPDVDSACIRLVPQAHAALEPVDEPAFFDLVKAAFAHRRKLLVRCLSEADRPEPAPALGRGGPGWNRAAIEAALRELGLNTSIRGEALSLEAFIALFTLLKKKVALP